jgi:myo-inositol-1(or 4)-monophosphatase
MLSEYIEFAVHLSQLAAREILAHFRASFTIDNKAAEGAYDPVTIADRNAEAIIRREIRRTYPDHGVIGEEYGAETGSSSFTWLIDPIDGTRAFVLGQLHWGTLIALSEAGAPVIGLMHQPFTGETFIGSGLGAELRHQGRVRALAARQHTRLRDAVICATAPSMFDTPERRAAFDRVAAHARSVRYGGDCYTPCMVAAGHADLVIEVGLKAWDIQPLVPIVESAGGVITDWRGVRDVNANAVVIAGNRQLHAEVIDALAIAESLRVS